MNNRTRFFLFIQALLISSHHSKCFHLHLYYGLVFSNSEQTHEILFAFGIVGKISCFLLQNDDAAFSHNILLGLAISPNDHTVIVLKKNGNKWEKESILEEVSLKDILMFICMKCNIMYQKAKPILHSINFQARVCVHVKVYWKVLCPILSTTA